MRNILSAWVTRFDALAKRERYLVMLAVYGGVLLIGWAMVIDPALSRARIAQRAIIDQRSQLAALVGQNQALQAPTKNPEALAAAELVELKKQLSALNERFASLEGELVLPERMTALLEEMLGRKRSVHLLSLRTLPAAPVLENKAGGEGAAVAKQAAGLYKHGVEIMLEGSYAELADYLARFEKSPQKLLWGSVSLSAENHPKLVLTLTVFTLSLDRTWLIV